MKRTIVWMIILVSGSAPAAFGLGEEEMGNKPVGMQGGWPEGILDAVNDPARVYRRWVNGNEQFYFSGGPAEINRIIAAFGKVKIERRELMLRAEAGTTHTFGRKAVAFTLCLDLPSGIFLHHAKEVGEEDAYPTYAKLILYLGDGKLPLAKLEVPRAIRVRRPADALGGLRRTLTHTDAYVRAWAANVLAEFGPDAAPVVPDLLRTLREDKEPYPRRVAAKALGQIGVKGEEVNAALRAAASPESPAELREAAEDALKALVIPKDPHAKRREAIAAYVEKRRSGGAKEAKETQ